MTYQITIDDPWDVASKYGTGPFDVGVIYDDDDVIDMIVPALGNLRLVGTLRHQTESRAATRHLNAVFAQDLDRPAVDVLRGWRGGTMVILTLKRLG